MKRISQTLFGVLVIVAILAITLTPAFAASTTKTLSTNFTLVNLGATDALVNVHYYKPDGSVWDADNANESFTILKNGGQKIIRQYSDATMTAGSGSVVIDSPEPLASVVQIQARGQTPTSGAYSGLTQGASAFYVPLVMRRGNSSSGTTNSQIIIQNTGSADTNFSVEFVPTGAFTPFTYNSSAALKPGASFYYDLDNETNLAVGWTGSAVVTATTSGGTVGVVSNFFTGPDAMQTFNAFPAGSATTKWYVPLFLSRLPNGLSSPVAVQNLGSQIAVGGLSLNCSPDAGSASQATLSVTNSSAISTNASFYFNPVTDTGNFPANWYGSCVVDAGSGSVISFVQLRYVNVTNVGAAAYEAIPGTNTDKTAYLPLIAKRLANGFATAVTIQNTGAVSTQVTLTYTPSVDYTGSQAPIVIGPLTLDAGKSLIRNHRLPDGEPTMPDDWFGSLKVTSTAAPISGFIQLTWINTTTGDTFMAHDAFTQP